MQTYNISFLYHYVHVYGALPMYNSIVFTVNIGECGMNVYKNVFQLYQMILLQRFLMYIKL